MMKTKVLSMLALLLMAATGAWAQGATTHMVTQTTVDAIFNGEGYTLGAAVSAGDILDFQGTIDIDHSLVINKQVNIQSSTNDAVVKLNTVSGYNEILADPGKSFVINKGGSGSTVQNIRIENTQTWFYNTSNVTFTGVTMYVKDAKIGSGVGHVAVRYSDYITFDGCTVYTENNGGSSSFALTGSNHCTFQNSLFESVGNVGNILYIGNPYNTPDKPADFDVDISSNDATLLNCTFMNPTISTLQIWGLRHRIEGCTVNSFASFSRAGTSLADGHIVRNNTFLKGVSLPQYSTFENNTVSGGAMTLSNHAKATGNAIKGNVTLSGDVTFTDNNVLGKLTTSKTNETITGNTIISTDAYAVSLTSTNASANNTVQNNVLMAAGNAGDAAVESKSASNTVSDNSATGTAGEGVTWTYDPTLKTLTVGGTGAMADYEQTADDCSTSPWGILGNDIERVVIGQGVSAIGANAFAGCTNVNRIIAKGTTPPTLGSNAFSGVPATAAVYVPIGQLKSYQSAWSTCGFSIAEYLACGTTDHEDDVTALYDATTKTLTISGTGGMADFANASDQPWAALQGQLETVVVESSVTAVGSNAFADCSALTAVYVNGSNTTVGTNAFKGNAEDRKIFVPLAHVNDYATNWTAYAADLRTTGYYGAEGSETDVVWEYNPNTKSLTISGTGDMYNTTSTSRIPWYSVRGEIVSVTIGAGVTSIGGIAFYGCSSLTEISIPSSVTSIGEGAFNGCSSLAGISIPSSVTSIGANAFRGCSSLTEISIPSSVTSIGGNAFYGCSSLTEISIPSSVTSIGVNTFYGCSSLTGISIPSSVTTIGFSAFRGCSSLTEISIPSSVTSIGGSAFYGCSSLTNVIIMAPSLTTYGSNAFTNNAEGRKIYVPIDAVETYKARWASYANDIIGMSIYTVTLAEGTEDAENWTISPTTTQEGNTVTITYNGTKRLKSVKAEKVVE